MSEAHKLTKTLTVTQAIALGVTIVVGSGLLILPGLAYERVGRSAIYAWLACALIVLPILFIFARLGARFPSAGGVAGFVQAAFGRRWGLVTEVILLGTFTLGIPAIALTGGRYFAAILDQPALATPAAFVLLLGACAVNCLGARVSGNAQSVLAAVLVAMLAIVGGTSVIGHWHGGAPQAAFSPAIWPAVPAIGLIFFAFTGWEILSFTAEEYHNPKRDFPIAVGASYLIVVLLYLAIAVGIQLSLAPGDPALAQAPLAAMMAQFFGPLGRGFVGVLGTVIIGANLIGAVWAASRLAFASAREGLLPGALAKLSAGTRTPLRALGAIAALFVLVLALNALGLIRIEALLKFAGQNFFVLYGFCVAAYLALERGPVARALGLLSALLVVLTMASFGIELLYPAFLIVLGLVLSGFRRGYRELEATSSGSAG